MRDNGPIISVSWPKQQGAPSLKAIERRCIKLTCRNLAYMLVYPVLVISNYKYISSR